MEMRSRTRSGGLIKFVEALMESDLVVVKYIVCMSTNGKGE